MLEPLPIELARRYEIQLEQTGSPNPSGITKRNGCATTGISAISTGARRTSSKAFRRSTRSSAPNISRNPSGGRRGRHSRSIADWRKPICAAARSRRPANWATWVFAAVRDGCNLHSHSSNQECRMCLALCNTRVLAPELGDFEHGHWPEGPCFGAFWRLGRGIGFQPPLFDAETVSRRAACGLSATAAWPCSTGRCRADPMAGCGRQATALTVAVGFDGLRLRSAPTSLGHHRPRSEVSDRALQLGMPEQQLNLPEILGSSVDEGSLGTTRLGDPRDRLESAGNACDRLAAPARPQQRARSFDDAPFVARLVQEA